jgi:heme-degrading monooxygenase HmoA
MMTRITQDAGIVTLINVFTVAPRDQQRLVDALVEATQSNLNQFPGFISANIHKSFDGTKVVNYPQWESREKYEAMLESPRVAPHLKQAAGIAISFEPYLYEVSFVDAA